MFGVQATPSDRQIKTIADAVDYHFFSKIFSLFLKMLERSNYLKNFLVITALSNRVKRTNLKALFGRNQSKSP